MRLKSFVILVASMLQVMAFATTKTNEAHLQLSTLPTPGVVQVDIAAPVPAPAAAKAASAPLAAPVTAAQVSPTSSIPFIPGSGTHSEPAAAPAVPPVGTPVKVFATLAQAREAGIDPLGDATAKSPQPQSGVKEPGFEWGVPTAYVAFAKELFNRLVRQYGRNLVVGGAFGAALIVLLGLWGLVRLSRRGSPA
jgi:hypothetical protein